MNDEPTPFDLALSAMKSLPQWEDFINEFKNRREEWVKDARSVAVYQSHPELVHVNARLAETDHWIERMA